LNIKDIKYASSQEGGTEKECGHTNKKLNVSSFHDLSVKEKDPEGSNSTWRKKDS